MQSNDPGEALSVLKSQLNKICSKPGLVLSYDEKLQRPLKRPHRDHHVVKHLCSVHSRTGLNVQNRQHGGIEVDSAAFHMQLLAFVYSSLSPIEDVFSHYCLIA